jgi:hypothetical protein
MGPGTTGTPPDATTAVGPLIIVWASPPDIIKKAPGGVDGTTEPKLKEQWSQGALKVRFPGKCSRRSVDVADNEEGVKESVPPVPEAKLATKSV